MSPPFRLPVFTFAVFLLTLTAAPKAMESACSAKDIAAPVPNVLKLPVFSAAALIDPPALILPIFTAAS